jgi:branched-subunit amino acid transport protein
MIPNLYFWQISLMLAVGTFTIRGLIIFMSARIKISTRVKEILTFIPAAILPAMVSPMVFFHQGEVMWLANKERMIVLIFASIVCYFTKNMLITIGFGLSLLYVLTQFN